MHKEIINIPGMHCRSCELLVEEELLKIDAVKKVKVSYKKQEAEIFSNEKIDKDKLSDAVRCAGYEISDKKDRKRWLSSNPKDYAEFLFAIVLVVLGIFILKKTGITNINFSAGQNPSSLIIVLVIGLTAGISTCMAIVGGLVLGISARHSEMHPEATPLQKFRPHLYFNLGRVALFMLFGGAISLLGKAFQLNNSALAVMMIAVAVVMIILGFQITQMSPKISNFSLSLPAGLSKKIGLKNRNEREYSHVNSFILGGLTFFLPCGFTQAMQIYAISAGNFTRGALIMGLFALGTTPGLLGLGGLTSVSRKIFAGKFYKTVGLIVVVFAFVNLNNGFHLLGFNGFSSSKAKSSSSAEIVDGVQVVRMTQIQTGYSPNSFQIKQNIPVKWIITSEDPNSCAASIVVPSLNIKKFLQKGENVIEFTPNSSGDIKFSCLMGMYTGRFLVQENSGSSSAPSTSQPKSAGQTDFSTNSNPDLQLITATYTSGRSDINPKQFTVKVNKKVRFEIKAETDVVGCMSAIEVPGLYNTPQFMEKGKVIALEFTPQSTGQFGITCSMGTVRGWINVVQ